MEFLVERGYFKAIKKRIISRIDPYIPLHIKILMYRRDHFMDIYDLICERTDLPEEVTRKYIHGYFSPKSNRFEADPVLYIPEEVMANVLNKEGWPRKLPWLDEERRPVE